MEENRRTKLRQMQALPLEEKVNASIRRIREWVEFWGEEKVTISLSGGKDSTVLLYLVRSIFPSIKAVFVNTGLEFPEIVEFVQSILNVEIVRPKKSFSQIIQTKGFPLVSKRIAQYIGEVQNSRGETATKRLRLTGIRGNGTVFPMAKIPDKWLHLINSGIKISDRCCKFLKKQPLDKIGAAPFVGTMAADSSQREQSYFSFGCNAFKLARPRSAPLSFWLEQDIWGYLKHHKIPYSKIYDMGYSRTGCMFCLFGIHLEKRPNRLDLMEKTHPQIYKYCMETLGYKKILPLLKIPEAHGTQLTFGGEDAKD